MSCYVSYVNGKVLILTSQQILKKVFLSYYRAVVLTFYPQVVVKNMNLTLVTF